MPVLFAAVLVIMGSFAMLLPAIMFVLANLGLSNSFSTPIIAVYSLAQFVAGPQWGRLSDGMGRKPVLVMALVGGALSYASMSLFSESAIALFVSMTMAGFCAGSLAVVFAAVSDITSEENRTKGMGLIGAAIGLSFVVGTAIGGSVSGSNASEASIVNPAFAAAIACAIGVITVLLFMKETKSAETAEIEQATQRAGRLDAFRTVGRHKFLFRLCLLIFGFTFCLALMEPMIPRYINVHFNWGPVEMRNIFIFIGTILVLVQGTLVGPMAKKFGELTVTRLGLALMGLGLTMLALLPDPTVLAVALVCTSVGTALFNASALSMASHNAGAHERGAVLGVAQSMQALGRSFGPLMTGFMFDTHSALPFFVGAGLVGLMLLVIFFSAETESN
ncbi:MAG: MFS transporter [Kordiimonadaceae bacterium]|nr:MFS transporter [Kordiimonadaceae bacterium]MBO6569976.1 MFS transporter [Kordiimonadaceae bacterium]MBO6965927.1 MFS transporter [Kordiimonadaceae bacterium]